MKKNIVVFMYNFPPIGAGRGIAWNMFCNNLSKDYNVSLITIEPSVNDPIYNSSKLKDIDIDINYDIYRTSAGTLYHKMYPPEKISDKSKSKSKSKSKNIIKKIYKSIFRAFIFPDRMVFWNKSAEHEFYKINAKYKTDLVVTVGFPFSTHLLGYKIKQKLGIKWVMDYGDPWSFNPSSETVPYFRRWLDRIVESKIVKYSDHITVTTDTTRDAFINEFNVLPEVSVVQQGVDYGIYRTAIKNKTAKSKGTIDIFYSGIFYKDIRNPESFFIALSLIKDLNVCVNVIIAGHMEDYVIDIVNSLSFPESINIKFIGNVDFNEVINYQINSDGLLFFGNKGSLQVPGKIYEYFASGTPIFSVSYQYDNISNMIDLYNRGITSLNSIDEIKNNFMLFISSLNGKYSNKEIKEFDWICISEKMNNIIKNVIGDK